MRCAHHLPLLPLTTHLHSPLTTHHSPLTTHHSPLTTHRSPLTAHHSPLTPHPSPALTTTTHHSPSLTTHHSPLTTHHSPLTTHHSPLTTTRQALLPHSGKGEKHRESWTFAVSTEEPFYAYDNLEDLPPPGDPRVDKMIFPSMPEHWRHAYTPMWQQKVRVVCPFSPLPLYPNSTCALLAADTIYGCPIFGTPRCVLRRRPSPRLVH